MSDECEHSAEDIVHVDSGQQYISDGEMVSWAECSCGQPTIVRAKLLEVEVDTEGTREHFETVAGVGDDE